MNSIYIDPGNFDRRVQFFKKETIKGMKKLNELGELDELLETSQKSTLLAECWAEVTEIRGSEKIKMPGDIQTKRNLRVVIRYRSDVNQATDLTYAGTKFDVTSVAELGRKKYLEIYAKLGD